MRLPKQRRFAYPISERYRACWPALSQRGHAIGGRGEQVGIASILFLSLFLALILIFVALSVFKNEFSVFNRSDTSKFQDATPSPTPSYAIHKEVSLGMQFSYPSSGYQVILDDETLYNKRNNGNYRHNFTSYVGYVPPQFIQGLLVKKNGAKDLELDSSPFTVWVFKNPNRLTAKAWYDQYWYYPFIWGDFTYRREQFAPNKVATIDGKSYYSALEHHQGLPDLLYLPLKDELILIRIPENNKLGLQIFSSLKFGD